MRLPPPVLSGSGWNAVRHSAGIISAFRHPGRGYYIPAGTLVNTMLEKRTAIMYYNRNGINAAAEIPRAAAEFCGIHNTDLLGENYGIQSN